MNTGTLRPLAIGVFVVSSFFMSNLSYAACRTIGKPIFNIVKGFGMDVYRVSDGGNCGIGYTSNGGTSFTSAKIAKKPSSGTLTQDSRFHFRYRPNNGFLGEDNFIINVCADYGGKPAGCVNNNYTIKVEVK